MSDNKEVPEWTVKITYDPSYQCKWWFEILGPGLIGDRK